MAEDLYVDIDALTEMYNQMGSIFQALDNAEGDVNSYDSALGSDRLEGKLNDFVGGWKDGRKKIKDGVASLADAIQGAVEGYNENEGNISKATKPQDNSTTYVGRAQ
jgi:hypothetical protein